jgi:hypothetical protein
MTMRATIVGLVLLTAFSVPPVAAEGADADWQPVEGDDALAFLGQFGGQGYVDAIIQSLPELLDSSGGYCTVIQEIAVCVAEVCDHDPDPEECNRTVDCVMKHLPVDVAPTTQEPLPCIRPERYANLCLQFRNLDGQGLLPWPEAHGVIVKTGNVLGFVPFRTQIGTNPIFELPPGRIYASSGYFEISFATAAIACSG